MAFVDMSSFRGSQSLSPQYLEAYIGHELVAVAVMFIVLDIICVALRITARYLSKTSIGLDDYLVVPALIFCVALCAVSMGESVNNNLDNSGPPKSFGSYK